MKKIIAAISSILTPTETEASIRELQELVESNTQLVDVRTKKEFSEGSAHNAINIPLDQIAMRVQEFNVEKDIVVFCRSGNRSRKAMNILIEKGLTRVVNGGTWKAIKEIQESNED